MDHDNANLADPRTPLLWGDSVHIKVYPVMQTLKYFNLNVQIE